RHEYDRDCSGQLLYDGDNTLPSGEDHIWLKADDLRHIGPHAVQIVGRPAQVDPDIFAFPPPELAQLLPKDRDALLPFGIAFGIRHHYADPSRSARLLRPRRQRPRRGRGAEEGEEGAAVHGFACHSITSSARTSSVGGTGMPSVRAVCRLMTNSNLV